MIERKKINLAVGGVLWNGNREWMDECMEVWKMIDEELLNGTSGFWLTGIKTLIVSIENLLPDPWNKICNNISKNLLIIEQLTE